MAKQEWHKVENVKEFLSQKGRRDVGVHSMKMLKRIAWPVCSRCGLMALRNDATRRALRAACVTYEDE